MRTQTEFAISAVRKSMMRLFLKRGFTGKGIYRYEILAEGNTDSDALMKITVMTERIWDMEHFFCVRQ